MAEYIDKEAALNTILGLYTKVDDDGYVWVIRGDAFRAVDDLPAADVREIGPILTKADEIRSMSDEELAKAFAMQCFGRVCKGIPLEAENGCADCWLDWLKQEVEE